MMFYPQAHGATVVEKYMEAWRAIHRPERSTAMSVPDLKMYIATRRVGGSARKGRRASRLWAAAVLVKLAPTGGIAR